MLPAPMNWAPVVLSDGIEHTVLIDESCPDHGVGLWIPDSTITNSDVAKLLNAIYGRRHAGTRGKAITERFVGTCSWDGRRSPRYVFKLERVEDLHVDLETTD